MAGRVFRQTRISTVIIFVHSGDAHLARLRIHQKSIGHRHVLLRRVLDPRELGHRFASRDVAHDGELLLLDGLEAFGQVTDARFDLHLDPDVALDQLTGLDDGRATSVNAVVRFVDVANEETAGFDDISAARLNLYTEGWVAKVKWLLGLGGGGFSYRGSLQRARSGWATYGIAVTKPVNGRRWIGSHLAFHGVCRAGNGELIFRCILPCNRHCLENETREMRKSVSVN